jgi:hypothetical protein
LPRRAASEFGFDVLDVIHSGDLERLRAVGSNAIEPLKAKVKLGLNSVFLVALSFAKSGGFVPVVDEALAPAPHQHETSRRLDDRK